MRILIPAAGYGTRVGMQPNQAKELLPGPDGKPMIDWIITKAISYGIPVHVHTRLAKRDLVDHLIDKYSREQVTVYLGEPTSMEASILPMVDSKTHKNLVMLPDTRFENIDDVLKIFKHTQGWDAMYGTHQVTDPENWGMINKDGRITDKPTNWKHGNEAWGVMTMGHALAYPRILRLPLINFRDLTRGNA